jgi:hypothetical protein
MTVADTHRVGIWWATGRIGRLALAMMLAETTLLLAGIGLSTASGGAGIVGTDFVAYFTAAVLLVQGQGVAMFDAAQQATVQQPIVEGAGLTWPGLINFINPPLLAAVVAPLTPLGLRGAALAWAAVNLFGSAAILAWITIQFRRDRAPLAGCLLLLGFAPFLEGWYFGQMLALLLLAFGGWLALSRAHRPFAAGLALSLLLLKPQYAPFTLIYLAWKRQWRQLAGFAAGGVGQLALTLWIVLPGLLARGELGIEALRPYFAFGGTQSNVLVDFQLNLRGLVWHALPGADSTIQLVVLAIASIAVLALLLTWAGRGWDPVSPAFGWEALALFTVVPVTAFHNNALQLYLLIGPLAAIFTDDVARRMLPRWIREGLGALLLIPAIGIVLGAVGSQYGYYLCAWLAALLAITLGVAGRRIALSEKETMEALLAPAQQDRAVS